MAAVVDAYRQTWNGSDLNEHQYHNGDYLTSMSECSSTTFIDWMEDSNPADDLNSKQTGGSTNKSLDNDLKQMRQFWKIRQFFNAIQRSWHKCGQVTVNTLKNFPLILFSPILDRTDQSKNHALYSGYFTDPNLASPRSASEADLFASISDHQHPPDSMISDHFGFVRLSNPTRRHCNSESDLTWTPPNNILPKLDHDIPPKDSEFTTETNKHITTTLDDIMRFEFEALSSSPADVVSVVSPAISADKTEEIYTISDTHEETSLTGPCTSEDANFTSSSHTSNDDNVCIREMRIISTDDDTILNQEAPIGQSCSMPKIVKNVSFADEVGQELTEIFVIESSDEHMAHDYDYEFYGSLWTRKSRFSDSLFSNRFTRSRLKHRSSIFTDDLELAPSAHGSNSTTKDSLARINETPRTLWVLCFPQPASQYYEFRQRIDHGSVSLENITLTQPDENSPSQLPQMSGTIKVKNISYEKQVWIRLTTDNWRSFTDSMAVYSSQLSGGLLHSASRFDTFTFQLNVVPQMESEEMCDKIEFAVRYLAGPDGSWGQYWDNNGGKNYVIEKRIVQSNWPHQLNQTPTVSRTMARSVSCDCAFDGLGMNQSEMTPHFPPYTQDFRPNFEGIAQFTSYRAWTHFAGETTYY